MENRLNILSFPHKSLRHLLGKWSLQIASTDPEDLSKIKEAVLHIRQIEYLLAQHAEHEDQFLQPLYNQYLPADLAKQLEDEHRDLETSMEHIKTLADTVVLTANRLPSWFELTRNVYQFIVDYLRHLQNEDYLCMPKLWDKLSDEDLLQIHQKILAAVDPSTMPQMLSNGLPALNPKERIGFLSELKSSMPEQAFASVSSLAQQTLGQEQWDLIERELTAI